MTYAENPGCRGRLGNFTARGPRAGRNPELVEGNRGRGTERPARAVHLERARPPFTARARREPRAGGGETRFGDGAHAPAGRSGPVRDHGRVRRRHDGDRSRGGDARLRDHRDGLARCGRRRQSCDGIGDDEGDPRRLPAGARDPVFAAAGPLRVRAAAPPGFSCPSTGPRVQRQRCGRSSASHRGSEMLPKCTCSPSTKGLRSTSRSRPW
jgi:hypothetical protein